METEDIKVGMEAKYRGSWAYVAYVHPKGEFVLLSNWQGIKTTTAKPKDIKEVREQRR